MGNYCATSLTGINLKLIHAGIPSSVCHASIVDWFVNQISEHQRNRWMLTRKAAKDCLVTTTIFATALNTRITSSTVVWLRRSSVYCVSHSGHDPTITVGRAYVRSFSRSIFFYAYVCVSTRSCQQQQLHRVPAGAVWYSAASDPLVKIAERLISLQRLLVLALPARSCGPGWRHFHQYHYRCCPR